MANLRVRGHNPCTRSACDVLNFLKLPFPLCQHFRKPLRILRPVESFEWSTRPLRYRYSGPQVLQNQLSEFFGFPHRLAKEGAVYDPLRAVERFDRVNFAAAIRIKEGSIFK